MTTISKTPPVFSTKTVGRFLALTFSLTWGLVALFILFQEQIVAIFGEPSLSNPLVILAVYSPGIAGVFLVWRYSGLKGLLLGLVWAVWHIPSFMMSGMPQSSWSVAPYFLGIVAISVILTPFFNAARGSLLVAVLYHFQMMNPLFPDAQPWDNLLSFYRHIEVGQAIHFGSLTVAVD